MADLIITGVHPYDGRYQLDLEREFTTREWGWIKRLAGYLPLQLDDNAFSDPELACALAVIVLHRAGKVERQEVPGVFDRLADAPFGSTITIEIEDDEEQAGDASPPATSSNGSSATSGESSATSSETSAVTRPDTGIHASATSVSPRGTPSGT
jgi:hypothetical protein